jgi:hypothetical protein
LRLLEPDFNRHMDDLVEKLLKVLLPKSRFEPPPELLSTLRPLGRRGPVNGLALRVASATKAAFDALRRGLELRITACSLEAEPQRREHLLLGVYSPTLVAEVRANDCVAAGALVALSGEPGHGYRLEVLPRVYRKICQNGLILFEGTAPARALDPRLLLEGEAPEPLARAIEQLLRDCFNEREFGMAIDRFREGASEPVDPGDLADSLSDRLGPEIEQSVHERFIADRDFTRWGLVNAVTAEARTAPGGLMLELERLGGALAALPAARGLAIRGAPWTDASLLASTARSPRHRKKPAA